MPISAAAASPSLSFSSSSIFFPQTPLLRPHPTIVRRRPAVAISIRSALATLPILSFTGDTVGSASLDLRSAPPDTARAVVHRGIITDQQNKRRGTASTLTRAEVRGGGRKPYSQKSTGNARLGSIRTPLRPGGGVIFGPKPRDWTIKINRKEKRLAISTALASITSAADAALVVEDFDDKFAGTPSTKEFIAAMRRWGLDPKEKATFLMMDVPDNVRLSGRNIGTLRMLTPRTLNLFDILNADKLVLTRSTVAYLNSVYGTNAAAAGEEEEEDDALGEEVEDNEGAESS